jgi:hypothetical protein
MPTEQNYSNHVRWYPLFHFVVVPLLALNFLTHLVRFIMAPGWALFFWVLLSITLVLFAISARLMALKAQDRVIRLEEHLRHQQVLTGDLLARSAALTVGQIIALRFASDDELPGLVERVLNKEFAKNGDIKRAIKNWRPDHHRV